MEKQKSTYLLPIDYAIISKGFSGKLSDIAELFSIQTVILCSDLNYFKHQALQKEADQLGIFCYSIKNPEHGYSIQIHNLEFHR